ncbi:hypothetical protein LNAOJCKE_4632 [Methylorubrum aminovorans]|uniref:XRE family transcriptional regulator n=2 Tax=Methylorubrum TaxID=2282523 RepID=A0ABU9ZKH7_9HYPH|nr:XRE family transcriptional regulator [Methylorubrum aminovorans]GJE67401.1 hypothetical protein LNAOJCKE_4632 [Methylorubrum aminovorans]GMA80191.1 hypothetical protein GCM10025880_66080 [Methylorubrum aminovorans]
MAKSVPAFINPAMLTWAREQARLTLEAAAKAIGIAVDKLEAAENGEVQLTFPQFLAAANVYKRAPSLFYLNEPPAGFQPIQDFRKLADAEPGAFTPDLVTVIRQAQERRELALELHADMGEPVPEFAFSAKLTEDEEALGERVRAFLDVVETEQQGWRAKAFDNWRTKIEARDVLVFLVPGLPLSEMRGAALAESRLPLILINSKDRTNGRTFTLLHEFCHLAIRASGVSGFGADERRADAARVEAFCNAVAAATLVPKAWLLREPLVTRKGDSKTWEDDELRSLALRFGVSREVVLRRLLTLKRTTHTFYESQRAAYQKQYDALNSKKATGAPPPPVVKVSQLGRAYAQLIFQGYYDRRLTLRDVSNYFNMQVKSVPALEQAAFGLKR